MFFFLPCYSKWSFNLFKKSKLEDTKAETTVQEIKISKGEVRKGKISSHVLWFNKKCRFLSRVVLIFDGASFKPKKRPLPQVFRRFVLLKGVLWCWNAIEILFIDFLYVDIYFWCLFTCFSQTEKVKQWWVERLVTDLLLNWIRRLNSLTLFPWRCTL